MAVGDVSGNVPKDSIRYPYGQAPIGKGEESSQISGKPVIPVSEGDTLSVAEEYTSTGKNLPKTPEKPIIAQPKQTQVSSSQQKEVIEKNPAFAQQSRMNDFFILMDQILKLLSDNRMLEDENRRASRAAKYQDGMLNAEYRKDSKDNLAAQKFTEMTAAIGDLVATGAEVVQSLNVDSKAEIQANEKIKEFVDTADFKEKEFSRTKMEMAKDHVGYNAADAAYQQSVIDFEDAKKTPLVGDISGIQKQLDDLEADMNLKAKARQDKFDAAEDIAKNNPDVLKNDPKYEKAFKKLESEVATTQDQKKYAEKMKPKYKSDAEQEIRQRIGSISQMAKSFIKGIESMTLGIQTMEAGEIEKMQGQIEATMEALRSYEQGQEKAVDQARQAIDELLRTFTQISEKFIQSLEGRA